MMQSGQKQIIYVGTRMHYRTFALHYSYIVHVLVLAVAALVACTRTGAELTSERWMLVGDCFGKIYRNEGWTAFFKGNVSNMLRSVGSSLVLVLYDELQYYLGTKR